MLWPSWSHVFISSTGLCNDHTTSGFLAISLTDVPHFLVFFLAWKLLGGKRWTKPKEENTVLVILPDFWLKPAKKLTTAVMWCWFVQSSAEEAEFPVDLQEWSSAPSPQPPSQCCVLCHPPCQPHTQQYTGFFSSFCFAFWWNMPNFPCLKPLVFCQIGWNCSTGSKCAWGKIANWQMARQCSHICLISWRNRLKMLLYNSLWEGWQRTTGKK